MILGNTLLGVYINEILDAIDQQMNNMLQLIIWTWKFVLSMHKKSFFL